MPDPAPATPLRLSPEQERVVGHRGTHLQVIACAGAGKTEAISRRVASLILEGIEPREIIAFTFTERAAQSLKTRITRRVAEVKGPDYLDRLGPMFVGTIHAYCLRMLQDHVPEYGNHDILDENRLAGLVSREYKRLELNKLGNKHWGPIFDFLRNADVVENELLDGERLQGIPFGECYRAYRDALERYHFLTYGQLISTAVRALARPEVASRVRRSLRYLIVDEYQDINPAQERLIATLAQAPVELCVVADDDQSIYQWRGSDVSNMLDFRRRYAPATTLTLSVNRRSRPRIIQAANAFAQSIAPRLDKTMEWARESAEPEIHGWAADTDTDEAETIAETILRLKARGFRYRDIAVLYRSVRTSSPVLIEALRERGIPLRCAGRTGLFLQPEAIVLGQLYAYLCDNPWKSERHSQPAPVELDPLVAEFANVFHDGQPIPELREYIEDWRSQVSSNAGQVNLVRDFYRLLRLLGVHTLDLDDPVDSSRLGTLARFSQVLADFEHVTRRARYVEEHGQQVFRGGQDRGLYLYRRLFNYLQHYALDAYEDFEGEDTFDLDAVDILTVHQSKGLEWPVVFLPSLVQGRFPSRRSGTSQSWLLPESVFPPAARQRYEGSEVEERRLFYVALTRAKDAVYLSRFQRKTQRFKPSPFLVEILGEDPPLQRDLPLPPPFTPSEEATVEPPTVSFSELASYEGCPLKYRFSTGLGFQPQLVAELGYGRAVHHILRHLAELTRGKQRLPTADEVRQLFASEFYLPFANQPAFHNLLARAQAMVGKYLAEYQRELLRVWETERPFELHLDKGTVKGQADVILDREAGVVGNLGIVDYKTANDPRSDDVFAFQLAIYVAAGRGEGLDVTAAYLHGLKESTRKTVPVDAGSIDRARQRADALIDGIAARRFPARPEGVKCRACDMRAICRHAQCDKYDI